MGYIVETHHYRSAYRKGDLEDEKVILRTDTFKLRKDAKAFIEDKVRGKKLAYAEWHKGSKPSFVKYFTGKKWIHENTGEECCEYYMWVLKRV